MCQEAQVGGNDKVLEIGTGSGYGAAVLSMLAKQVFSIERIEPLFEAARERLQRLGYSNVTVSLDDGTLGLPGEAPFDAIIVTAGAEILPSAYQEQLADGGRLVIPIGPAASQQMTRFTRLGEQFIRETLGSFGFVPLVEGVER
jgi:protein-L-isoaspartate(D-aspartate) O-methyltransferase